MADAERHQDERGRARDQTDPGSRLAVAGFSASLRTKWRGKRETNKMSQRDLTHRSLRTGARAAALVFWSTASACGASEATGADAAGGGALEDGSPPEVQEGGAAEDASTADGSHPISDGLSASGEGEASDANTTMTGDTAALADQSITDANSSLPDAGSNPSDAGFRGCARDPSGDPQCASPPHFYRCMVPYQTPSSCSLLSSGNLTDTLCCP